MYGRLWLKATALLFCGGPELVIDDSFLLFIIVTFNQLHSIPAALFVIA